MAQTLYASFADASLAEKAAGALLDYGVRAEDLSLVTRGTTTDAGDRVVEGTAAAGNGVAGAVGAQGAAANYQAAADQRAATATSEAAASTTTGHTRGTDDSTELAAKSGLSTTTPADAGAGAAKGAGIDVHSGHRPCCWRRSPGDGDWSRRRGNRCRRGSRWGLWLPERPGNAGGRGEKLLPKPGAGRRDHSRAGTFRQR